MKQGVFFVIFAIILDVTSVETGSKMLQKKFLLVDPCSPSPCVHGSCFIGNGNNPTFFCLCPSGFHGQQCETVITTTAATITPILTQTTTTFISTTAAKTTAIQTTTTTIPTTPANPCSPIPCVRGSCYTGSGNNPTFFCLCPNGFTGLHCETVPTIPANSCSPSPCVHGSCFIGAGNNPTFFCQCPSDFTGLHCETVITTTTATTPPIQTTTAATTTTTAYKCPIKVVNNAMLHGGHVKVNGDSCFEIVPQPMTWNDAERHCNVNGGHLAYITSQAEEDFIMSFGYKSGFNHSLWIGLSDQGKEEHWTWTSGYPFTWSNWIQNRFNSQTHYLENCVALVPDIHVAFGSHAYGKWDDLRCGNLNPSLCRYDAHPIQPVTTTAHVPHGLEELWANVAHALIG